MENKISISTSISTSLPASIPEGKSECQAAYTKEGYAIFPCFNKKPFPSTFWKQSIPGNIPPTASVSREFGVVLKPDDLIIDIDPRNMGGRKVWTELKTDIPALSKLESSLTVVQTGGGGFHLYFRKPAEHKIKKSIPKYPGIEFLTAGNYVIGAGSVTPEGRMYKFLTPPFSSAPTPAPQELLTLLRREIVDRGIVEAETKFSDSDANISRFIKMIENHIPVVQGDRDNATFKIACRGRDCNLSPETVLHLLMTYWNKQKCGGLWTISELKAKVHNAYTYALLPPGTQDPEVVFRPVMSALPDDINNWQSNLIRMKTGAFVPTLLNAVEMLKHEVGIQGKFSLNIFTEQLEVIGHTPWEESRPNIYRVIDDREIESIRLYLTQKFRVEFTSQQLYKAVDLVAAGNVHHPVRDHILSLAWDGVNRLDSWLQTYCGVANREIYRVMGRKTLIALIARVFDPGCQWDYVLVLEGEQGIGKSTVCKILGGPWFGDAPVDPKDKDSCVYIHTKWLIELSEMITTKKSDADRMKNFISRTVDDLRIPYGRLRTKYPRQCVFIGTVNPDDVGYLTDTTGNRRYWPVYCTKINLSRLKIDRDQLIAEAYHEYQKSETLTLPDHLVGEAEQDVSQRHARDPWFDVISSWIDANPELKTMSMSTTDIYTNVLQGSIRGMHTGHLRRISQILRALGWQKRIVNYYTEYVWPQKVTAVTPVSIDRRHQNTDNCPF